MVIQEMEAKFSVEVMSILLDWSSKCQLLVGQILISLYSLSSSLENPLPRMGSTRRSNRGRSPSSELNSETPARPQNRPSRREPPKPLNLEKKAHSPPASSDEGEDTHGQPLSATVPQSANLFQDSPTLISISPSTGSPSGKSFYTPIQS